MSDREKAQEICNTTSHKWTEDYYGWKCEICGDFIPYGCEPWLPVDDEPDEESHSYDCTCESCLQNHPERDILYNGGQYFNYPDDDDD